MTLKQITIAMFIINSITTGSSMTMYKSQGKAAIIDGNHYVYQPKTYFTPDNQLHYFYPNHTSRTDTKTYDRDFKKALLNNLDSLRSAGASKETLKIYATNGLIVLKKNKRKITKRQQKK